MKTLFFATLIAGATVVGCGPDDTSREVAAGFGNPSEADTTLIAQGRMVYAGVGSCFACHGPDAKGTPIGPDLSDDIWLNVNGAVTPASIASVIRAGVAEPVEAPAPMPPMGGAALSDDQVQALAAYIYSLSQ